MTLKIILLSLSISLTSICFSQSIDTVSIFDPIIMEFNFNHQPKPIFCKDLQIPNSSAVVSINFNSEKNYFLSGLNNTTSHSFKFNNLILKKPSFPSIRLYEKKLYTLNKPQ